MKKSFYLGLILVFSFSIIFAQKSINSYKYILVPKQYEFLKSADKYQVNSLTKFLFDKAGYTVLFTDEQYPNDLAFNSCLALKAVVVNNPSLFNTKLIINLMDCHNTIIYTTKEGKSKEKEYKKAYHDALRKAFAEFEELDYAYDESLNNEKKQVVLKEPKIQAKETPVKPTVETKEVVAISKLTEKKIKPVVEKEVNKDEAKGDKLLVKIEKKPVEKKPKDLKKVKRDKLSLKTLEGSFIMGKWGSCIISKKENNFSVVGGDENFEFATIFKTSIPTVFIIKWGAYKQPQLLEIVDNGNLKVDTENGTKIYKRIN